MLACQCAYITVHFTECMHSCKHIILWLHENCACSCVDENRTLIRSPQYVPFLAIRNALQSLMQLKIQQPSNRHSAKQSTFSSSDSFRKSAGDQTLLTLFALTEMSHIIFIVEHSGSIASTCQRRKKERLLLEKLTDSFISPPCECISGMLTMPENTR